MPTIHVTVKGKFLKIPENAYIVADNADYLMKFDFDDNWPIQGIKTLRVNYGTQYEDILFDGDTVNLNPMKYVPTASPTIYIGIHMEQQATTQAPVMLFPSVLTAGGTPAAPEADVYQQLIALTNAVKITEARIDPESHLIITTADGMKFDAGYIGCGSGEGGTGEDGGCYIPSVSQKQAGTMTMEFTASREGMEEIQPQTIVLPRGEKGEAGISGQDGVSPVVAVNKSEKATTIMVTDKNGTKTATIYDGDKGEKGDPYTLTEGDKAELAAMVIEALGGQPIFGVVDENNNIVVSGNLADGTYSVKYEMEDGETVNIGNLVLDTNVYYSVTNSLTNCTNSNSATQAVQGGSYSATITAKSGYELKSIVVKMGGADISSTAVRGGEITISNVTGNIVITAVAEEVVAAEPVTVDITLTEGIRIGSDGTDRTQAGYCATPHIDLTNIPKPCTIHLTMAKWAYATSTETGMIMYYAKKADGSKLVGGYTNDTVGSGYFTVVKNGGSTHDVSVTVTSDEVASLRFSGTYTVAPATGNFADVKATLTYTPKS